MGRSSSGRDWRGDTYTSTETRVKMDSSLTWMKGTILCWLVLGAAVSLPNIRTVRQALEGFPDGLPALTPKGVKLSLDQILNAAGDLVMNPIPGEAGFDCISQDNPGIYTDTEARCQSFYMCTPAGESASFLCPNGTIFNQQYFVCDWWYNIDCDQQPSFYSLNELLNQEQEKPNCQTLFCKDD